VYQKGQYLHPEQGELKPYLGLDLTRVFTFSPILPILWLLALQACPNRVGAGQDTCFPEFIAIPTS